MLQYIIAEGSSAQVLGIHVNLLIRDGYTICGNAYSTPNGSVNFYHHYQPMTRVVPTIPPPVPEASQTDSLMNK